ncbi:MAG: imidazolonepropionase [Bacteriovoracaceae bacterium]|jgi:imidazolonepropionase|nr:imidazolonepropionase [Bacteriovoracaceae bacterium]
MKVKCIKDLSQIVTLKNAYKKDGRNLLPEDLSIIKDGAIVYNDDKIIWVGSTKNLPTNLSIDETQSLKGHIITPGICDSHTHLVFGGDRSFEYSLRLNGADYEKIAKAGGGILNTMENTVNASFDDLYNKAIERINRISSYGVKAIEIKTGYALTIDGEQKLIDIIQKLKKEFKGKVTIKLTYMGAHAVPKEYSSSKEFIQKMVIPLIKKNKDIIDFVDIFHERGYFDDEDLKLLFSECDKYNLKKKIHADEFNDNKGAVQATQYNCTSADHLLCTTDDGIKALSHSSTVATILPGTALFLGKPLANAKAMLDSGVKLALASDYNPGSCHCDNLLLLTSITAKNLELNIAQVWSAITMNAYHALDIKDEGIIDIGMKPSFNIFNCDSVDKITYSWGRSFFVK